MLLVLPKNFSSNKCKVHKTMSLIKHIKLTVKIVVKSVYRIRIEIDEEQ